MENFNNRIKSLAVFLDLQKAFDLVDHTKLLDKLDSYGIRGVVWEVMNAAMKQ